MASCTLGSPAHQKASLYPLDLCAIYHSLTHRVENTLVVHFRSQCCYFRNANDVYAIIGSSFHSFMHSLVHAVVMVEREGRLAIYLPIYLNPLIHSFIHLFACISTSIYRVSLQLKLLYWYRVCLPYLLDAAYRNNVVWGCDGDGDGEGDGDGDGDVRGEM